MTRRATRTMTRSTWMWLAGASAAAIALARRSKRERHEPLDELGVVVPTLDAVPWNPEADPVRASRVTKLVDSSSSVTAPVDGIVVLRAKVAELGKQRAFKSVVTLTRRGHGGELLSCNRFHILAKWRPGEGVESVVAKIGLRCGDRYLDTASFERSVEVDGLDVYARIAAAGNVIVGSDGGNVPPSAPVVKWTLSTKTTNRPMAKELI